MMMYYVPMMPGMYKTFMTPEDSFWCCTGTGMENHAKYGDSIYFHDGDGLFVNLFIASELDWAEKGLKVRQETRFPEEPKTTLVVHGGQAGRARPPHPRSPAGSPTAASSRSTGRSSRSSSSPSSYLTVRRVWKNGDRVEVALPMELRLERLPDRSDVAAILYGPIVLAGELGGAEGLTRDKVYGPLRPGGRPGPGADVRGKERGARRRLGQARGRKAADLPDRRAPESRTT